MEFLAGTWWIWLIVTGLLAGAAVALQLKNMSNMHKMLNAQRSIGMRENRLLGDGLFKRFAPVFLCLIAASFTLLLAIIGIVIAIIQYFTTGNLDIN